MPFGSGLREFVLGAGTHDLSDNLDFTLRLIEAPLSWRQRVVETLLLAHGDQMRTASAFQVEFPPGLLAEFGLQDKPRANAIIPLGMPEKRPLQGFDLTSTEGGSPYLLERSSIAAIQAGYLLRLVETSAAAEELRGRLDEDLLEAISLFTPGLYRSFLDEESRVDALRRYLESGLGFAVTTADVEAWLTSCDEAASLLRQHLDEPPSDASSSECVLLALPDLDELPQSGEEVAERVAGYAYAVRAAANAGDHDLLRTLCEYGRRYQMLIELELPLGRPTEISVFEDRPLHLERGGWIRTLMAFKEARSTHIEISLTDPNVDIEEFDIVDLTGRNVALGPLEAVRFTRDTLSLYSSAPDRPPFVSVGVRLRSASYVRWSAIVATAITASAVFGIAAVDDGPGLVGKISLLALPTAIAAAFVLTREETGLATRLITRWRFALGTILLGLWLAVFIRVLHEGSLAYVDAGWDYLSDIVRRDIDAIRRLWP